MAGRGAASADDARRYCRHDQDGYADARSGRRPSRAEPAGCRRQSVTVEPTGDGCSYCAGRTPAPAGTAYGADIGTATTIKALHARWTWLRTAHPALFEGLQPLVSLKQNPRTNRAELHLIVGPYSNADAAEQFCDFIVPFHLTCEPAMFDGSRLALQ